MIVESFRHVVRNAFNGLSGDKTKRKNNCFVDYVV